MKGRTASPAYDYIEDMMAAITRVETYVEGLDRPAFLASTLVQDAVIRNFEILGEAANRIRVVDAAFAREHLGLRLDLAYAMRNSLIHGYGSVNLLTVWNTVQNDLPLLKQQLAAALPAVKGGA